MHRLDGAKIAHRFFMSAPPIVLGYREAKKSFLKKITLEINGFIRGPTIDEP